STSSFAAASPPIWSTPIAGAGSSVLAFAIGANLRSKLDHRFWLRSRATRAGSEAMRGSIAAASAGRPPAPDADLGAGRHGGAHGARSRRGGRRLLHLGAVHHVARELLLEARDQLLHQDLHHPVAAHDLLVARVD